MNSLLNNYIKNDKNILIKIIDILSNNFNYDIINELIRSNRIEILLVYFI